MARLPTLQRYILREMGKSFVLSTIGLTGILSTCGGVVTLLPLESITASQTLILLALVVPVCAAFTLPIAALFSATITYGRMSADNEFTAIRASGVNSFALLRPCLYLSILSAVITFMFFNFLIPSLTGRIRHIAQASIKAIMSQSLSRGRGVDFKNFRVYADEFHTYTPPAGRPALDTDALWMKGVAFIEFESGGEESQAAASGPAADEIVRFGTAESAVIKFDLGAPNPQIEGDLAGITFFDLERYQVPNSKHQRVGPFEILRAFRTKPRHLSLPDLLDYRHRPEEVFHKVAKKLQTAQHSILAALLFDHLQRTLADPERGCNLQAEHSTIHIISDALPSQIQRGRSAAWLPLTDVTVREYSAEAVDVYESDRGKLTLSYRSADDYDLSLQLAGDIQMYSAANPQQRIALRSREIAPLAVPQEVVQRFTAEQFSPPRLWDKKVEYDLGPEVQHARKQLRKERRRYLHRVYAEIHVRAVYSVSVILVAVLGAALGIIFRGGQVLVAFGISFVPTLFVIVSAIVGKNLAKGQGTLEIGLAVMWLGLGVVLVVDCVVFKRYFPR